MSHVFIKDGPHQGKSYNYPQPVPELIVLAHQWGVLGLKYHDYVRPIPGVDHFTHSPQCPCYTKEPK